MIPLSRLVPLALAGLAIAAALTGGPLAYAALLAVLAGSLGRQPPPAQTDPTARDDLILVLTGLAHFAVLFAAVHALAKGSDAALGPYLSAAAASGLFLGQVSNAAAHELIHAPDRARFWLGACLYSSLLFGHHASAHRLVHHLHVATPQDPNSAAKGTSLYRFLPQAWAGSFRAGLAREKSLRKAGFWRTPYPGYFAASGVTLALSFWLAGWAGVGAHIGLALYATLQLLTTDYVQHYGLRRQLGPKGKPEPVGPAHAWDAPGLWAGWMTFNAPRHGAHHIRPQTPYGQLDRAEQAMVLPYSLAVMGFVAFVPRWFRRVMKAPLARAQARAHGD